MTGRRPQFTIASTNSKISISFFLVPYIGRYDLQYQIMDGMLISNVYQPKSPKSLVMRFLWTETVHVEWFHLKLQRFYQIICLMVNKTIVSALEVHDGPGIASAKLNIIRNSVCANTFQAFIVKKKDNGYQTKHLGKDFLFEGRDNENIEMVSLSKKEATTQQIHHDNCNTHIIQHDHQVHQNFSQHISGCYMVLNISTNLLGYVNMTILGMTFQGPDINNCGYGGIAFDMYQFYHHKKQLIQKTQTLCDNYTNNPNFNILERSLPSMVSYKNFILLTLYSYLHYSNLKVNVIISRSPCQGTTFIKRK